MTHQVVSIFWQPGRVMVTVCACGQSFFRQIPKSSSGRVTEIMETVRRHIADENGFEFVPGPSPRPPKPDR